MGLGDVCRCWPWILHLLDVPRVQAPVGHIILSRTLGPVSFPEEFRQEHSPYLSCATLGLGSLSYWCRKPGPILDGSM